MGLTLADARKSCKAAKAHKAYEYTKPDEALFEPYKPFDLKEQSQLQQQQVWPLKHPFPVENFLFQMEF